MGNVSWSLGLTAPRASTKKAHVDLYMDVALIPIDSFSESMATKKAVGTVCLSDVHTATDCKLLKLPQQLSDTVPLV